ncbi:MAG TPA: VOC family protein, partial [Haliangiales bacterium]|nr:VOC family protein [Haliangiales bacterium]
RPAGPTVASVGFTVADLDGARSLFADAMTFRAEGLEPRRAVFALGTEKIELRAPAQPGRAIPADSRSNDLWFQHMAIVVSDIDAAYARVRAAGATPTSPEPQTIPVTNAAAAGIRAFYFRDGEGHNLELIWYPPGKGDPRWQDARGRLFLGIDHTAIGVADTDRSVAFYRDLLGMEVKGGSLNEGIEQERLSGVPGARVRITGLRGAGGPGVELLEYLAPAGGRPAPADTRPDDAWYWEIVVVLADRDGAVARLRAAGAPFLAADVVRDPDGHAVKLVQR